MKTILLPTDFSKNSISAINYTIELFKDQVCDFYILNVQKASSFISDDMMVVSSSTTIYSTLIEAAKKSIKNIISSINENQVNDKHTFHPLVDYDNFINSINQIVEKHNIDLIVMGTKGASGLNRILFGSNTVRVMRHCNVPLLAIPNNCKFTKFNQIGFVTNHITLYNRDSLKVLKDLTAITKSKLTILHLTNDVASNEYMHNRTFFNLYFNDVTHKAIEPEKESLLDTVNKYKELNHLDLIAIVKKQRSFFEYFLRNFTEEEIAYSSQMPLLILSKEEL